MNQPSTRTDAFNDRSRTLLIGTQQNTSVPFPFINASEASNQINSYESKRSNRAIRPTNQVTKEIPITTDTRFSLLFRADQYQSAFNYLKYINCTYCKSRLRQIADHKLIRQRSCFTNELFVCHYSDRTIRRQRMPQTHARIEGK